MKNKFAGKSDEAVVKATGKSWDEWFKILDSADASKMPHKDIVRMLHDKGLIRKRKDWPEDKNFNAGWWAQSIVVGYEEKIGRRVFGAKTAGNYSVTVGKSLAGTPDDVLKIWQGLVKEKTEFNKVKIEGDSRISSTDKWRYWKVDLVDGSKIMAATGPKVNNQSAFSVTMDKLKGEKEVEMWRRYWKKFLEKH